MSRALSACAKVGKPTEEHAKHLGTLYPSSSRPSTSKDTFNPVAEVLNLKKSKGSRRPFKLWVVIGEKMFTSIPKSTQRKTLNKNGRVKKLEFRRSMSKFQVKNVFVQSFPVLRLENPKFMKCVDFQMILVKMEDGYPNGNVIRSIASKESLYVVESEVSISRGQSCTHSILAKTYVVTNCYTTDQG